MKVSIAVEAERAGGIVAWMFARKKTGGASAAIVEAAALDAYSRLIHPSLENELRAELTAKAPRVPSLCLARICASCCCSRPSVAKP